MDNRQTNIFRVLVVTTAVLGVALASVAAASSGTTLTTEKAKAGTVIGTSTGHALYMFSLDSSTQSKCTGPCASAWPPLTGSVTVARSSGLNPKLLGTIKRGGGPSQVTYNRHPLYLFSGDKAHATKGEGNRAFGGRWYLVGPRGGAVKPTRHCKTLCQGY